MNYFTFFSYQTCFIITALSARSAYEKALKSVHYNSLDPINPEIFDEWQSKDEALACARGCEYTIVSRETMRVL